MIKDKLFVVRYYVKAKNATEAIKKAKKQTADDVWIDEDWKKGQSEQLADAIGFETQQEDETRTTRGRRRSPNNLHRRISN